MTRLVLAICAFIFFSESAPAGIWNYIQRYKLGIDYSNVNDNLDLSYRISRSGGGISDGCSYREGEPTKQTCDMNVPAGQSNGWGIFLQQAFKRTGDFYFTGDIGFGARYLAGGLAKTDIQHDNIYRQLPLKSVDFRLLAGVVKPYVQFGYTPVGAFPDILFTIGPTIQTAVGTVKINDQKKNVAVVTASQLVTGNIKDNLLANIEIVFCRFGDGALSIFAANDNSGNRGTPFYPGELDSMDQFQGNFTYKAGGIAYGYGIKLLLNWP